MKVLLKAGAKDVDSAAITRSRAREACRILKPVLETGKVRQETLDAALFRTSESNKEIREALAKAGAKPLPVVPRRTALCGRLRGQLRERVRDGDEGRGPGDRPRHDRGPDHCPTSRPAPTPSRRSALRRDGLRFERNGDKVHACRLEALHGGGLLLPAGSKPVAKVVNPPKDVGGGKTIQPANWPQFRGPYATGVADGQDPPITWDVKEGTNVRWKTPIPGLGHSCPVVWGDRVFLTTAVGGEHRPSEPATTAIRRR